MEMLMNILSIVYVLCCIIIIVMVLLQKSEQGGASESIMGSSGSNFYEKNKGRTKEGMQKRWTIILGIVFAILTIVLGIIYVI